MKIAILGGTFNPLHIGHCLLADTVKTDLGYDKIIFVPTGKPPHKKITGSVSAEQRFLMLDEFCKTTDSFIAEDYEIKKEGLSFTYETILYLLRKYENVLTEKPGLIMGQEVAAEFYKWHKNEEIAELSTLILARRHPDNNSVDVKGFENENFRNYTGAFVSDDFEKDFKWPHIMLENPILPISSTEIRSRIAHHKSFEYLVPREIFLYIKRNGLYQK